MKLIFSYDSKIEVLLIIEALKSISSSMNLISVEQQYSPNII